MTAVDTVPSTPTAMTPYGKDYLTDPRLGRVGIMTLKKHIEKSGQVEKDLLEQVLETETKTLIFDLCFGRRDPHNRYQEAGRGIFDP